MKISKLSELDLSAIDARKIRPEEWDAVMRERAQRNGKAPQQDRVDGPGDNRPDDEKISERKRQLVEGRQGVSGIIPPVILNVFTGC